MVACLLGSLSILFAKLLIFSGSKAVGLNFLGEAYRSSYLPIPSSKNFQFFFSSVGKKNKIRALTLDFCITTPLFFYSQKKSRLLSFESSFFCSERKNLTYLPYCLLYFRESGRKHCATRLSLKPTSLKSLIIKSESIFSHKVRPKI